MQLQRKAKTAHEAHVQQTKKCELETSRRYWNILGKEVICLAFACHRGIAGGGVEEGDKSGDGEFETGSSGVRKEEAGKKINQVGKESLN